MSSHQLKPENAAEAWVKPGPPAPDRLLRGAWALLIDLLFPPRCSGCGRVDTDWCDRCQSELERTPFTPHVRPLKPLDGMASTAVHEGIVQRAIWSLKYENARSLAVPLAERLVAHLQTLNWKFDMIVPVPMHVGRLLERGYNQAQLLAEQVAMQAMFPCVPTALVRERYTPSQVGLGREARLTNVADAFRGDSLLVGDRSPLLIDDVYTTGATLSACAEAALAAGAKAVYGLSVSVARL
jgi:ComF family protein